MSEPRVSSCRSSVPTVPEEMMRKPECRAEKAPTLGANDGSQTRPRSERRNEGAERDPGDVIVRGSVHLKGRLAIRTGTATAGRDGVELDTQAARLRLSALKGKVQLECAMGRAAASAIRDQDGVRLGGSLNAGDCAITIGKPSKESGSDEVLRIGLQKGVGLGARRHHSDEDGDGKRERGFGFDAGPVTFDLKTESPRQTLLPWTRVTDQARQAADDVRRGIQPPR